MSKKLYIDFIKETIKNEGIEVADKANKIALSQKKINTSLYSEAAQLIVKAYLSA